MNKKFNVFLTGLFCAFLGGMLVISLILPDKDFSPLENRYLQKVPTLSLNTLKNGQFMEQAESYASDHVPGRDLWVAMKSWCERLSGKQENNGVYFGKEGALINRVDTPDPELLSSDIGYVNKLAGNVNVPVYLGLIPSAAATWHDKLPKGAPTADEFAIIKALYADTDATTVDLIGALSAHKDEAIYYRTDHHWTSLGAYYGANALLSAMGMEELNLSDYEKTTVSTQFYGTIFSSSGVRWVEPDPIDIYIPEENTSVTSYFTGTPTEGELYVERFLDVKDKYSYFLGGNQPLCIVRSEKNPDAPKVMVIRDSYSDALAPFLTERFSEIHLYDLRYNKDSVKKYVEDNGIDAVVVLYSFSNFASDKNLKALGR